MSDQTIHSIEMHNDDESVFYCQHCLSLKILMIPGTINCYCGSCGNTEIFETKINCWEELYVLENGKTYLEEEVVNLFDKKDKNNRNIS